MFGRGGEEVEALTRAGVRWEVVPGVSSAFGVPAAVGIPVTHRGLSSSVTVVTGRWGSERRGRRLGGPGQGRGDPGDPHGDDAPGHIADALQRGGKAAVDARGRDRAGHHPNQAEVRTTLGQLADVDAGLPGGDRGRAGGRAGDGRLAPAGPLAGRTVVVTRSGPRAAGPVDAVQRAGAQAIESP